MELIFLGLGGGYHFYVGGLHTHSEPFAVWTEAEGEDLGSEVVLCELSVLLRRRKDEMPRVTRTASSKGRLPWNFK